MPPRSDWRAKALRERLADHARRGLSPKEGADDLGVTIQAYYRYLKQERYTTGTIILPDRTEELNDNQEVAPAAAAR